MEEDLDLLEQTVAGVHFWERIRFPVQVAVLQKAGLVGQSHTVLEHNLSDYLKGALLLAKNLVVRNPYRASRSDVFFLGSPRRKLRDDGLWWDIYCDPIIEALDWSYAYFEAPYLNRHMVPQKTQGIRYLDAPLYWATARQTLGIASVALSQAEKLLLKSIEEGIQSGCGVAIDVEQMVGIDLLRRKTTLPAYLKLLERVRPRISLLVDSSGNETFIEACKTLGIPAVELQHGVMSRYTLSHSYVGEGRVKRTFPDYLFVFGDYWKETIDYPIPKERIWSIGFPYLESELRTCSNANRKRQLLFISEGTTGGEMSRFAVELAASRDLPWKIVYKLHPGEYARWRTEYPWLATAPLEVVDDDTIPLYRLFAESQAQVGVCSTAVFEGLAFGLRTLLLDLPGIEHVEYLLENGFAALVREPAEIAERLRDRDSANRAVDYLFQPHALANVDRALRHILVDSRKEIAPRDAPQRRTRAQDGWKSPFTALLRHLSSARRGLPDLVSLKTGASAAFGDSTRATHEHRRS